MCLTIDPGTSTVVEWSEVSSSPVACQTLRRSVNDPQAELMRPNPFHPGRLGKKGVPRAYAVLRQVAREQGGREDKGRADPED